MLHRARRYPPIPPRPSVDVMERFAPELFELCERQHAATLRCGVDLDDQTFFAVEAILAGKSLGAVLAFITPGHPATFKAKALLRAAWVRHRAATAATRLEA